jgi:hypothetical protein
MCLYGINPHGHKNNVHGRLKGDTLVSLVVGQIWTITSDDQNVGLFVPFAQSNMFRYNTQIGDFEITRKNVPESALDLTSSGPENTACQQRTKGLIYGSLGLWFRTVQRACLCS